MPLIDELLVLLIVFMASTSLAIQRIPRDLPYRSDKALPPAVLQARLHDIVARAPDARLQLTSDQDSEYRALSFALTSARNAGLRAIDIEQAGGRGGQRATAQPGRSVQSRRATASAMMAQ